MKNLLNYGTIICLGLFLGHVANAATYSWQFEGGRFVTARTPYELQVVHRLYSSYLVGVDADDLDSVMIVFSEWSLVGETKCAANDPKLHTETTNLKLCIRVRNQDAPECQTTEKPLPDPPVKDPCD